MNYVIIGASAAGINAARTLRKLDKESNITIVSKDVRVYSRVLLHYFIGGKKEIDEISFIDKDFFEALNINWLAGHTVMDILCDEKKVITDDGVIEYDRLLIASGANSFIPPIKGLDRAKEGIATLRNIEDAIKIKKLSQLNSNAVVIGAGLIGLDVTVGLMDNGVEVHLMEIADRIIPVQLDKRSASTYEDKLTENNVNVYKGIMVDEILLDNDKVIGVRLADNCIINTNLVVVAAGVRPSIDFVSDDIKKDKKGIVINSHGETSVKDIYAAGDACGKSLMWSNAVKQGINAAHNMAGYDKEYSQEYAAVNTMSFFDITTASIGNPIEEKDDYVHIEDSNGVYKKIISRKGYVIGAILQGSISYSGVVTKLMQKNININKLPKKNIFDISKQDI